MIGAVLFVLTVAHSPLSFKQHKRIIHGEVMKCMVQKMFGDRIREIRTNKGISQEKFALSINMDRTYYSSVEAGKRNVSLCNIKKIADGLEIPMSELFKGL